MIETFLAIYVVNQTLSWKNHSEQITHKLSAACYTIRSDVRLTVHRNSVWIRKTN